jgi:hypothetical protein
MISASLNAFPIDLTSDILQNSFADHVTLGQQPPATRTKTLRIGSLNFFDSGLRYPIV